jgi:hypothetical protein
MRLGVHKRLAGPGRIRACGRTQGADEEPCASARCVAAAPAAHLEYPGKRKEAVTARIAAGCRDQAPRTVVGGPVDTSFRALPGHPGSGRTSSRPASAARPGPPPAGGAKSLATGQPEAGCPAGMGRLPSTWPVRPARPAAVRDEVLTGAAGTESDQNPPSHQNPPGGAFFLRAGSHPGARAGHFRTVACGFGDLAGVVRGRAGHAD